MILQIGWNRGNNSRPYARGIGMGVFIFSMFTRPEFC